MKTLVTILFLFHAIISQATERIAYAAASSHTQLEMHYYEHERILFSALWIAVVLLLAYRISPERYFGINKVKLFHSDKEV